MISIQYLLLTSLIFSSVSVTATSRFNLAKRPIRGTIVHHPLVESDNIPEDFKTFYYDQTLDHFNYRPESYSTFRQRYVINFKNWGGANASAPIFAYLGAEGPLDEDIGESFQTDNAARFKCLLVYIEHRYYGKSIPFGSREEAMKNASTLGYFNSAQALADFAEVLVYLKKKYHAEQSPVIVLGGSYGGMLATWFRLKYPHVALGALASSAPILNFDNITQQTEYDVIVTKDYREASETCYRTIRKSWSEINKIASNPIIGLSILSKKFKTCQPLKNSTELTDFLQLLFEEAAQYDSPPEYPVNNICSSIDGAPAGTDILSRIFAGVVAYLGKSKCYVNAPKDQTETDDGWSWQVCSEMVSPMGVDDNSTMFQYGPFVLSELIKYCKSRYGVPPRPHWITTYYGGHDIKLILQRFASNIIFSNGLRDPYSSAGVLKNISDTIVAVPTVNGSHCLDLLPASPSDPEWLTRQREIEVDIIEKWIAKYYADLKALRG
ncbi:hypothetical protein ACOSP7_016257 [Xanthoceras sorbifolium]